MASVDLERYILFGIDVFIVFKLQEVLYAEITGISVGLSWAIAIAAAASADIFIRKKGLYQDHGAVESFY